jgi:hypothetical protein
MKSRPERAVAMSNHASMTSIVAPTRAAGIAT